MHSSKLQFSLIENARDFLDDTITRTNSDQASSWKYAIISLASAIELIMKSVLEKEHWSLLFENVDSASKEHLESGQFKSVDFETAQVRLQQIANVKLSERDKQYLTSLRNIRNRISHFKVDVNVNVVKSVVARGIAVFFDIYKTPHLESQYDERYEAQVNSSLRAFDRYVRIKMATLKSRIESSSRPAALFKCCQTCYQDAVVLAGAADDHAQCLYCGEEGTLEEFAARDSELPVEECPQCGTQSLAFVLYNNEDGEFVCVKCGFKAKSIQYCWECGAGFVAEEGETLCQDCWDYKLSRD
jgi:hypothetical protein